MGVEAKEMFTPQNLYDQWVHHFKTRKAASSTEANRQRLDISQRKHIANPALKSRLWATYYNPEWSQRREPYELRR